MITKKRIRKVYPPLNIISSVETYGNPAQMYNTSQNKFFPDRSEAGNELKLYPKVFVETNAADTTWVGGVKNSVLTEIAWYVNGAPIESYSQFTGKYSVDTTATDKKGTLTITKNMLPAEHYEIMMYAKFYDPRNNVAITIATDSVSVFTTEMAEGEWDLSVVHDVNITYHPLLDKLKEYDWKVENGIIEANESVKASCYDGNQYDLTLPIIISRGIHVIDNTHSEYSRAGIKLYAIIDGVYYEVTPENALFVKSVSVSGIRLDLRYIPDGTKLEVQLFLDGHSQEVRGQESIVFTRVIDDFFCEPTNGGDIDTTRRYRPDKATCYAAGKKMEYPEAYLDINWYTNSSNSTAPVFHGSGENIEIDLNKANVGTGANCWLEVYTDCKVKAYVAALVVEGDGTLAITNEDNEIITTDVLLG